MADSSLIYLYGIAPLEAPDAPEQLTGLEGGRVRVVRHAGLAALVSEVPAEVYEEESLNARLTDVGWVGERGLAHERVLSWYADRGPVVPLTLFSLHRDEARLQQKIEESADRFRATLDRLAGRREWGIKLWRDEARFTALLEQRSESLAALAEEMRRAAPGKKFLLAKKLESLRSSELRRVSAEIARDAFEALRARADGAVLIPLPEGVPPAERTLALHAAFLVAESGFDAFQQQVSELAAGCAESGIELEFTGPWPAYHFAS